MTYSPLVERREQIAATQRAARKAVRDLTRSQTHNTPTEQP